MSKSLTKEQKLISKEIQNKIDIEMRNSICEIEYNESKIGNGFLCKIPYLDFSQLLPVLIINTNIINEIKFLNDIKISFDNNKIIRYIKNIKERKVYINQEYEIIIIEIFPNEDNLNIFLEIDENIFKNINYNNKYISILNYSNKSLYGIINNVRDNIIEYKSLEKEEMIDGPIILIDSLKVIGINKRLRNDNGILLRELIKGFNRIENEEEKNEINLIIKVNEDEINKDIYILNYPYYTINEKEYKYEGLKELNELNTTIFINDELYEYKKYKKFEEKGEYKIKIKFKILLKDCYCMFLGCKNMINIDLSKFNSKNVTNMSAMFRDCNNLTNINLSNFETRNVINMNSMFCDCKNLTNIDVSNFETKNVTNMQCMFCDCTNLINIDVSNFDTKNVTDMSCMFYGCNNLINIDLSNFDTKNVTNMQCMFCDCNNLTNIDVSNFDTKNVTDMSGMFYGCNNLTKIDVSNFDIKNVTDMGCMFYGCNNLYNIDLS